MNWLESKYISMLGPSLTLFKPLKASLWNFRCPLCGDSTSDSTKCRGYIYLNKKQEYKFKCHKCGENMGFTWFLKTINSELYREYKAEYIKENGLTRKTRAKPVKAKPAAPRRKREVKPEAPKLLGEIQCVTDLPASHFMVKYISDRMIPKSTWSRLYWCQEMKDVADLLDDYDDTYFDLNPRLLLPFISTEGVLTHIQGRGVGPKVDKKARYYTLEVESGHPKVFGLDAIDFNKPAFVVEGPIDSLFLSNTAGMGGSDVPWSLFPPETTTFVFDNEPRSPIITKKMSDAVAHGFGVCVWGTNVISKDINDMVKQDGRSSEWLQEYILNHTFRGMKAKMAISKYAKRKTLQKL